MFLSSRTFFHLSVKPQRRRGAQRRKANTCLLRVPLRPLRLMGNDKRMPYALIPAAGKSRRMGRPKVSLPLGGRTVVEHVIASLQQAGVEEILVVLGPQVAKLASLVERTGARVLLPAEPTHTMRATVEQGLTWLENRFHPRPRESWFLVPADYPILEPAIVQKLLRKRR